MREEEQAPNRHPGAALAPIALIALQSFQQPFACYTDLYAISGLRIKASKKCVAHS